MKLASRAAGIAIASTALVAGLAPAASAHSTHPSNSYKSGLLRVCINGLHHGDEADVEVDGTYADRDGEYRGCRTWRLPVGWYQVSVDGPRGYDIDDDDAWVKVSSHYRKTVRFNFDDNDYYDEGSHWHDGSYEKPHGGGWGYGWGYSEPTFVKRAPNEYCPGGYAGSYVTQEVCVKQY